MEEGGKNKKTQPGKSASGAQLTWFLECVEKDLQNHFLFFSQFTFVYHKMENPYRSNIRSITLVLPSW